MKDLGFNEFGELQNSSGQIDEETSGMQTEMTGINSSLVADDDGEEEAENTEIAI